MNIKKDTECSFCGSIKVIEIPASFTSSVEVEILGAEPEEAEYSIFRCLVCGRGFDKGGADQISQSRVVK